MLIDFWGPDAKKGQKSHAGTLEDVLEPDLRVGEEVLLIAPEEKAFAEGQLCYRHEMIVKEVGADPAFANQVKLKFKKWPAPKYDIWVDKRSWKMERATKERLKQRAAFNSMYEKVKKCLHSKRSSKDSSLSRQPKDASSTFQLKQEQYAASNDQVEEDVSGEDLPLSRQNSADSCPC
jgi:hypothetical protein